MPFLGFFRLFSMCPVFGYLPLFLVLFICGDSTGHRWSMVFLDLARVQNHQYITHWDLPTECLQQEISSRLLLLVGSGGSRIWWSDIYNAVDARTGTNFFKEYLLCLLGSKAVIYVTHQVEFLPVADLILVIKDAICCSEQEPMLSLASELLDHVAFQWEIHQGIDFQTLIMSLVKDLIFKPFISALSSLLYAKIRCLPLKNSHKKKSVSAQGSWSCMLRNFSSLLMEALSSVLDASIDKDVHEAEEYMRKFSL